MVSLGCGCSRTTSLDCSNPAGRPRTGVTRPRRGYVGSSGVAAVGLVMISLLLAGAAFVGLRLNGRTANAEEARHAQWSATANAETAYRKTAEALTATGIAAFEQGHSFDAMHRFAQAIAAVPRNREEQSHNRLRLGVLEQQVPHLRAIFEGHGGRVWSAAFSPDGARVVTASRDNTARVWEAANGRLVAEFKGHGGWINSAAFSPDGARVVTASKDNTARVWRLAPLPGEAVTLPLWVEVFTGTELQGGGVRPVSAAEWQTRRQKLLDYGSKAPPTPWLLGKDRNP